jgi:class 3 adenylate cyclase
METSQNNTHHLPETEPATSEPARLPSGTVTFLFTDIEVSTRLLEQLREEYAIALAQHATL